MEAARDDRDALMSEIWLVIRPKVGRRFYDATSHSGIESRWPIQESRGGEGEGGEFDFSSRIVD